MLRIHRTPIAVAAAILLATGPVRAQEAGADHGPYLVAPLVKTAPQIDGALDDACWKDATWHEADRLVGKQGASGLATRFAVARDEAHLYIAVRCRDPMPGDLVAKAPADKRDGEVWKDDHVRIFLSPLCTAERVIEIQVNPNGALRDLLRSPEHPDGRVTHGFRSKTGQPHTASRVTDDGYAVEIGIWRRKSFPPDPYRVPIAAGEAWLFNLSRHKHPGTEAGNVSSWTGALHDTSRYGSLMMGPTDVALTHLRFGNGHVGVQPVSAMLTNLTDEEQTLDVKAWGEAAGWKYWLVYHCKESGVGPAFTTRVVLKPGQSARVAGELNVLTPQHDIRMVMEARKAGQSEAVAHVEHFFIARSDLDLHLHETEVDTASNWLDVYMSSDLPTGQTEQATVSFSLRNEAGETIGAEWLAPFRGGRREVGYYLPELSPGKYDLHGRLVAEDGKELATTVSRFSVLPPEEKPAPAEPAPSGRTGTIDLGLRELAGSDLRNQPITFGVPFPDGLLASPEALTLADGGGNPIPFRARTAARWRRSNYVKWVLFDALVNGAAGATTPLQLQYGTPRGSSHTAGTFRIEQTGNELVVTTGPMRFSAAQGNGSLIDRIWIDRNGDSRFDEDEALTEPGAGLVATITHEDGTVHRANMGPGAGLRVEEAGPFSVHLKAEGWFELARAVANPANSSATGRPQASAIAERLCKYIVRIRAIEGSSELRVHHTFVFTEDSRETRLADIALTTRLAGAARESDFGVFRREGASHLSLLQHGPDAFAVFEPEEAGLQKPLLSDKKAPGWAALATDRGEVLAGVRDFWQLYPKELEVEDSELRLHIWPAHGKPHRPMEEVTDENLFTLPWSHEGGLLDLHVPERYRDYKISRDNGLEQHALNVSFNANAIGLAKTHEITLSFSGNVRDRRQRAALGRIVQEPPVCAASPEWMCDANVFGAVKMNPVDRERFPRIEAALEGWFDCESRLTEFVKAYGMFNYLDAHNNYYFNLRRVSWWRVWANTHHGGPRVAWLLFGRSGEPKYLRAAHRRALNHMDVDTCHHTNPHSRYLPYPKGKIKGALNDYKGLVHWNSGNRLFDYNTMMDYLFYDYYLTGNRRALDVALEWGEAVLKLSPSSVPGGGRGGAGVLAALCFLYEETGDKRYLPYLRSGGAGMLRTQMDDGYFGGFWTTYAPWRGRYVLATDGDAAARESLRRWCDNVTDWRYNDSIDNRPQGTAYSYLDTFPISEDLASGYFLGDKNVDYARLALGVLQMFSWGMYEGDEYPQYRGWNGIGQFCPTLKSYISQTAPYALRAIADCPEPIEPLYRRTAFKSSEGLTAYLDVPQDAVLHVSAVISLYEGGDYQLSLAGAAERTYGPVPIAIKARQNPQLVEWRSPERVPAGEWKLTIAGKKGTNLIRLTVPEAKRITYRIPVAERLNAPAIYFLAPRTPGKITWQVESRANEANGAVLIDPAGKWAGRATWLDIDKSEWHPVEAEVTAEHAGKPWLFGTRQYRALLRPPENVAPYFAMTRDAIFIPQRP